MQIQIPQAQEGYAVAQEGYAVAQEGYAVAQEGYAVTLGVPLLPQRKERDGRC